MPAEVNDQTPAQTWPNNDSRAHTSSSRGVQKDEPLWTATTGQKQRDSNDSIERTSRRGGAGTSCSSTRSLDVSNVELRAVLGQDLGLVHHLELLGRILPSVDEDRLLPALRDHECRVIETAVVATATATVATAAAARQRAQQQQQ